MPTFVCITFDLGPCFWTLQLTVGDPQHMTVLIGPLRPSKLVADR